MVYMEWSNKLSVGVDSIDTQHKKLVSMINELFDAMKAGRGKEKMEKTLDGLIIYTASHFSYEENLFAKTAYPDAAKHKKEHDDLTKKVLDIQKRMKSGVSFALSMEVLEFLKGWLVNHILGSDKKYGPHLISKGVK
jgi:hemerythrin-like metal-binding protein